MNTLQIEVGVVGRDQLKLTATIVGESLADVQVKAVGCPEFLRLVSVWRLRLQGLVRDIAVPQGNDHSSILLRELVLRLRGEWRFPYVEVELCHCRAVATTVVDEAVVCGAETVAQVSRETLAGTGCGTCRRDIQAVLDYRREQKQL